MTLPFAGKTVIERCVAAFDDACRSIIVVTGPYHEEISRCLAPYAKVRIVHHPDHRLGMFGSVKAGVRHVTAERFFVTPGDYPLLRPETVTRMIQTPGCVVAPAFRGRQGHPILLCKRLIPAMLRSGEISLRDHLAGFTADKQVVCVTDIGVVTDIDTPEAYRAAMDKYARRFGRACATDVAADVPGQGGSHPACDASIRFPS